MTHKLNVLRISMYWLKGQSPKHLSALSDIRKCEKTPAAFLFCPKYEEHINILKNLGLLFKVRRYKITLKILSQCAVISWRTFKLREGKIRLDIRKKYLILRFDTRKRSCGCPIPVGTTGATEAQRNLRAESTLLFQAAGREVREQLQAEPLEAEGGSWSLC